jgi:hypothetical protein
MAIRRIVRCVEHDEGPSEWTGARWETEEPAGRDEFQSPDIAASDLYELDRMTWLLTDLYFRGSSVGFPMEGWISEKSARARDAAERIRQLHESVTSPREERVSRGEWETNDRPWVRRALGNGETIPCYFCGGSDVILSYGDKVDDSGRLELYCNNPRCDAREVAILVVRGGGAHLRKDVQALKAVELPE